MHYYSMPLQKAPLQCKVGITLAFIQQYIFKLNVEQSRAAFNQLCKDALTLWGELITHRTFRFPYAYVNVNTNFFHFNSTVNCTWSNVTVALCYIVSFQCPDSSEGLNKLSIIWMFGLMIHLISSVTTEQKS